MIVFLIVMSCVFNCFFCFDRVSWHKVCRCFVELLERTERLGSTNTKASVFRRLQSLVVTKSDWVITNYECPSAIRVSNNNPFNNNNNLNLLILSS